METLPDLENLPNDLGELDVLFQAVRAHCQALADAQPAAYSVVDRQPVVTYTPQEQQDELNEARKVAQEIAVKMNGIRLAANTG